MGDKWSRLAARGRREAADLLLAAAVLAFTIPTTLIGRSFSLVPAPEWLQLLAGSTTAATMLVRRRTAWPMIIASVLCACLTGQVVPLTLAAYSMTAEDKVRRWQLVAGVMTVVYAVVDYVNPYTDRWLYLVMVRAVTLTYLPALVGTWVREYRRLIRELSAGARLREELAASQERRWIAGELHDTVTHAVTVMVLNAGIIQDTKDSAEIRELAANIEDKGMQALTELRELLTVLRRRDVPPSAEGVEAIPALVEDSNATGLRVSLHLEVPADALSRQAGHACYRVVQEGLNNVRKHAPGSDVRVSCAAHDEVVNVSVVNSGHRPTKVTHAAPSMEPGYGLAGLRERVTLAGGRLMSGPTPEGGFELTAQIPFHPPDAPS